MELERFLTLRPWAYHLTDRRNVEGIRHQGALFAASCLAKLPAEKAALKSRRNSHLLTEAAVIRDQRPLIRGHIEFAPGFEFEQLLAQLNSLVFFWPGSENGPVRGGCRHFNRYQSENPAVLRVPTRALLSENKQNALVCRYNSGSPRTVNRQKSPRGPETFLPVSDFAGNPSAVVELVLEMSARLPASAELGDFPSGPWVPLFSQAG